MRDFCFVHAADLHLDTPFEGIRAAAPEVARALRDASLEAFDALVALCLERDAAFLLLGGDLYDGAARGVRAQLRFRSGLERLSTAGIPVFAVHGNHDPCDEGWNAVGAWPERITFFGSDEVASVPVERDGEIVATVHGLSYATRETTENLAVRFRRGTAPGLHLGLLHCNVGGSPGHADYSPCSLSDLAAARMDYWALGHIHQFQVLRDGDPWIVYPGVLQGRSPKPSERGAKGAVVARVSGGGVVGVEPVALDRVRFVEARLDVSDCADFAAVEQRLHAAAAALRSEHEGRGLVMRARLVGRTRGFEGLGRKAARDELLEALREASAGMQPFLWWESVASEVRREIDRAALRGRDDFAGELCELGDALASDLAALASFLGDQTESLPPTIRGVALPEPDEEPHALLRAGEELALDSLELGEPE